MVKSLSGTFTPAERGFTISVDFQAKISAIVSEFMRLDMNGELFPALLRSPPDSIVWVLKLHLHYLLLRRHLTGFSGGDLLVV